MIFIVHKNYENYVSTMLTIMALGCFVLFVGYCIVPERIVDFAGEFDKKRLKRAGDGAASPLNTIRFFNQYIELRRLAIVILLSCSAISCLTIIQGYTVAQYGWTQTKSVVVLVTIGVFAGPSVIFSPLIIAKKGAMRAVQMAFYMMMVGLAILAFSPMNPLFLYIGCGVVAVAAFGAPAYLTLISNFQLANTRFGELQSGMGAMALLAMSLGTIFYSTLFLFLPKSMRFLIFLMGAANMVFATLYFNRYVVDGAQDVVSSRINIDDAFDDEEEDFGFVDSDEDGNNRSRSDSVISV